MTTTMRIAYYSLTLKHPVWAVLLCMYLPGVVCLAQIVPGTRVPDMSEALAIGIESEERSIGDGTRLFDSLVHGSDSHAIVFQMDAATGLDARFMREELHTRLHRLASKLPSLSTAATPLAGKALKLKVIAAWHDRSRWEDERWIQDNWSTHGLPLRGKDDAGQDIAETDEQYRMRYEAWKTTLFSHHEGRGIDFTLLVDNAEVSPDDTETLPALFDLITNTKLSDQGDEDHPLFDFVEIHGVPRDPRDADSKKTYSFIHASIKPHERGLPERQDEPRASPQAQDNEPDSDNFVLSTLRYIALPASTFIGTLFVVYYVASLTGPIKDKMIAFGQEWGLYELIMFVAVAASVVLAWYLFQSGNSLQVLLISGIASGVALLLAVIAIATNC